MLEENDNKKMIQLVNSSVRTLKRKGAVSFEGLETEAQAFIRLANELHQVQLIFTAVDETKTRFLVTLGALS